MKWKKYNLDQLVSLQRGHDLTVSDIKEGPYPVAGSNGPIGFHEKFTTKGPSLTLGRSGNSIGVVHFYEENFWAHNTTLYAKEFYNCDPKFLYYLLKTLDFSGHNSGSAVPSLNRNYIASIEVIAPCLETQNQIASILSSLDDKIELNRRMNQTLEQIAATLFKKYFVDDIDPDNLPEGWKLGRLGDVSINIRRGIQPSEISPDTIYLGLEHLPRRSLAVYNYGTSEKLESNKFKFAENNILFGKLRPYFHKVVFAPYDGVCSTDILVIEPIATHYFSFCLFHFFSEEIIEYSNQFSDGTRMPRVNWESLAKYEVAIPPIEVAMELDSKVLPLIERIKAGIKENKNLEAIRDTLLPKLMSGEIDLSTIHQPFDKLRMTKTESNAEVLS